MSARERSGPRTGETYRTRRQAPQAALSAREAAPQMPTAARQKSQRAFDKERRFAVSLKGSPLEAERARVLRPEEESRTGKRFGATHSIEA